MIKSTLKKIFPAKLLKDAFLAVNKLKIKTWDKIFFPEKVIDKKEFLIQQQKNPFLDCKVPIGHFESIIQKKLLLWRDPHWTQDQYLLHYKKEAYIEPDYGWAVTPNNELIYSSLGFSRAPYVRKPNLLASYTQKRSIVHIAKIISMRDTGEENYFHFYNDVVAKLFFIEDQGFNLKNFTIVIAEKLFTKQFFQSFYKNTRLKDLDWHVQKKEWIHFEEAIFCKPYTHTKKYLDVAVNLLKPKLISNQKRRIFLTRPKNSLRFIENMADITPLLSLHQFEIVDTADMEVAEQIKLFSECQYLISIHGAGLINIIFRQGNPLTILEIIQPSDYIPFHYIMLAHNYSYGYDVLLGERGVLYNQGGFRVNAEQLRTKLESMLKFQPNR
jgi:hypothetical protein